MNYLKSHGQTLLKEVSRSFYITMRVLPRPLREPVSLAYLLARATDTLADAPALDPWARLEMLTWLREAIAYPTPRNWDCAILDPAIEAQRPSHPGEARLLEAAPELLNWLAELSKEDAAEVRRVLDTISQGQILDIERFELDAAPGEIRALSTAVELEDYTYRVAGCVGDFWTRLALRKLRRYSNAADAQLMEWAVKFGKGLQLVNILRDFGSDVDNGRCYLPGGMDNPSAAVAEWSARADEYLRSATEYTLSLRSWRMRFACAVPVALGFATLRLINSGSAPGSVPRGVKVPRGEVRRLLGRLVLVCPSVHALRGVIQGGR